MDEPAVSARYAFAQSLIREAGDYALTFFNQRQSLTIKAKGPQDMASEADLSTELLIRDRLSQAFPRDGFLGEETGAGDFKPGQGIWVVDPIDGTQPFISGLSTWCVSMAFLADDRLRFGMVYAPARGEFFEGGEDYPATLNGRPVERHPGRSIRDGIVSTGYSTRLPPSAFLPYFTRFIEAGGMFYRDGSGALDLCYVAAGRLLGYIEAHINSWDCLGGIAVIRAAGLKTSDFLSDDGLRVGNKLIAGNESVYAELTEIFG